MGALLLLPVALVLLLPAALAIKLTSRGPVVFCQTRTGRDLKPFTIYKLRSLRVTETGSTVRQVSAGDARLTPVGAVLRRTSLDELPQIFNVLRGEMSLVGPRPHALHHDAQYGAQIARYRARFHMAPGMTGLAQVRGQRGPTETLGAMRSRIESDLEYIGRASLWLDLRILARTVGVVVQGKGAV